MGNYMFVSHFTENNSRKSRFRATNEITVCEEKKNEPFRISWGRKLVGGFPNKMDSGALRGTKILFCVRGFKFFSPLRDTNSYITHYLLSYFFPSIP